MNKTKNHIYDSVLNFMENTEQTKQNFMQYRDLFIFQNNFSRVEKSVNKNSIEIYEASLMFNCFIMKKIEDICRICNSKMILKLSEQEIVDWFFSENINLQK